MQTFLPYADFEKTAKVLDYRRLGKQRVESYQLMRALLNLTDSKAWRNHPAARMWRGHEGALALYSYTICQEWISRGYKDSLQPFFKEQIEKLSYSPPRWLGDEAVHASHRSNLLRKDHEFYSKNGWVESDDLPYVWPV
jgi:hypothetical protein